MSSFAALLRRHRAAAGLSQERLAERAQMSVEGVSALERGYRQRPQRQTVAALAAALDLSGESLEAFETSAARPNSEPSAEAAGEASIPLALSNFIGREDDIAAIATLLRESRIVTIVGSGGVGKTQTALRVVGGLRASGIFGARFVGLASLDRADSVIASIASAVGVQEQTGRSLESALCAYLRNKNLALVLDNCEHVIGAAAAAAAALLAECPRLRVLATSRERLNIGGERTYRLAPLSLDDAVVLFADRANCVDHHFGLTSENRAAVLDICRRLDGLPLAIELAAARVNLLSLEALAGQLHDRLRLLAGSDRTALAHHQTMRATIDWSFDLLRPRERQLYEYLSIFSGGCTLDGAIAVAPPEPAWRDEMLDLLSSLAEKSLLTVEFAGTQPRYRYLESFRTHACEKLGARGETAVTARRHAEASLSVAQKLERAHEFDPNDIEPELENARSAIEWATAAGEASLATRIAVGFTLIWRTTRGDAQPRRWLEALLPLLDERIEPEVAACGWRTLGSLRQGSQKIEAAERAFALAAACQDPAEQIAAICQLTLGLMDAGRLDEADSADETALEICRRHDLFESRWYARVAEVHAFIAVRRGRFEEARKSYAESLRLTLCFGSAVGATSLRHNLAELELLLGNAEHALELATAAANGARRMRFGRFEAISLTNCAACSLALGDHDGARRAAHDALELAQSAYPWAAIVAIQHLATVAALSAAPQRGALLRGYVDAWYRGRGCERDVAEARAYVILMEALRERLSEAEIATLATEGGAFTEEEAALEALAI
ncbi:MAG TPA: helix-turn-helix domain-containing protein [Candidatus Cybelea sp.]|jgi:predicted ATPase/DNA-binding XRE family transcriptional regulator|nr:helix-turn-helix domain-containing protein [Candidatus Cybelea sp.]